MYIHRVELDIHLVYNGYSQMALKKLRRPL